MARHATGKGADGPAIVACKRQCSDRAALLASGFADDGTAAKHASLSTLMLPSSPPVAKPAPLTYPSVDEVNNSIEGACVEALLLVFVDSRRRSER